MENIFDIAKNVYRQLEHANWQYIDTQEAAQHLVSESEKYYKTGSRLHDRVQPHRMIPALAEQFASDKHAIGMKEIELPEHVDRDAIHLILYLALGTYHMSQYTADKRAWADYNLILTDEGTLRLTVADIDHFDFKPIYQKIDYYKIAIPRIFQEFRHGGKDWVITLDKDDRSLNDVSFGMFGDLPEQAFIKNTKGEYIPHEYAAIDDNSIMKLGMAIRFEETNGFGLPDELLRELDNAAAKSDGTNTTPKNTTPKIFAIEKSIFLKRLNELGIEYQRNISTPTP